MDFGQIKLELHRLLYEDFKSLRSSGKQKQRFLSKFSKIIVLAGQRFKARDLPITIRLLLSYFKFIVLRNLRIDCNLIIYTNFSPQSIVHF